MMFRMLATLAIALVPFAAIAVSLWVAAEVTRRRDARHARQIMLTDAIHRELGAAAAPFVDRPIGGGWQVSMAVPLERPDLVAALVDITTRTLSRWDETAGRPFRIVLTPAPAGVKRSGLVRFSEAPGRGVYYGARRQGSWAASTSRPAA